MSETLHQQGLVLFENKDDRAMDCLEKAAIETEKEKGLKHADTAQSLYIYAMVSLNFGKADRAIPALKKSLEIRREVLGRLNSSTAITVGSLGNTLMMSGHFQDAEPFLLESLSIADEMLGKTHTNTAYAHGTLARCYELQKRFDEAIKAQEMALRIHEEVALEEARKKAKCMGENAQDIFIDDVRALDLTVLKTARGLANLMQVAGKDPAEVFKPYGGESALQKHLELAEEEERGQQQVPSQHVM